MRVREPRRDLLGAYRVILFLAGACLGLSVLVGVLLTRFYDGSSLATLALQVPAVREEVVETLLEGSLGQYDSHVDGDVGHTVLPGLEEADHDGVAVTTNRFGMRESEYEIPKPENVVRVVLLGDSMVYGSGTPQEDRLGVHLEGWLRERASGFAGRIECLHIGAPSWNLEAQCSYLRRQLSLLEPDLVVQISVPNDIEDSYGVRGFGALSSFSTQTRERADSQINAGFAPDALGFPVRGYIRTGVDYEGRSRFAKARAQVLRMQQAIEEQGGSYRLILHFRYLQVPSWRGLGQHLDRNQVVTLPRRFARDRSYWNSEDDPHWNRRGHETVARLIYGLITRDDLLPELDLQVWEEASETLEALASAGRKDAERRLSDESVLGIYRQSPIRTSLSVETMDATAASQVHGGIDKEGRVSPYASFILKNDAGKRLRLSGQALPRPELDGARVEVFVEEAKVGELVIEAGAELQLDVPLPQEVRKRSYVSVRLRASDYVYAGPELQHCVVFKLRRVWIES